MITGLVKPKGMVLIPNRIRKKHGLKPGTKFVIIDRENEVAIKPFNKQYFEKFAGILSGKGDLLEALRKEKEYERNL